jgi:hypothetical protein
MLLLAALAATAAQPIPGGVRARQPAQATVTIVRDAARLRFSEVERQAPHSLRTTVIRSGADAGRPIRLVEYP